MVLILNVKIFKGVDVIKKTDYSVFIGRFQPFHDGHFNVVKHALRISNHVIIIVGSANVSSSIRNPWNVQERYAFIKMYLKDIDRSSYTLTEVDDSAYSVNSWVDNIYRIVNRITHCSDSISLVGYYKDNSSYYLKNFPNWHLNLLELKTTTGLAKAIEYTYGSINTLSSVMIRTACFEQNMESIRDLNWELIDTLEYWMKTPNFLKLKADYDYIKQYQYNWKTPYPPVFVTCDAVVFNRQHVLLIKRKSVYGNGKYALPGGFLNQDETVQQACIRELHEETGLKIITHYLEQSIKSSAVFDNPLRDPLGRVITHAFMFNLNLNEILLESGDDASDAFWYPIAKLKDIETEFFNDHALIINYFINSM